MTNNPPTLLVKRLDETVPLPAYQTHGAAGFDLAAHLAPGKTITLAPGERHLIPTGLAFGIPSGYELQIRPRSGLSVKHGAVAVLGTIDCDYIGHVQVILHNISKTAFTIHSGDRIAQAVLSEAPKAKMLEVDRLAPTGRGEKGFGSSGVSG